MAAAAYETIPDIYEQEVVPRPKLVKVTEAESWLLRGLSSSLAVRNNIDVRDIPDRVPVEIDDLFTFIENRRFADIKDSVSRYVQKRSMQRKVGMTALDIGDARGDRQEFFATPDMYSNAVAIHIVSSYSLERFGCVHNAHLSTLHEVDLSNGMPEDRMQQDKTVMYCMASAVCDVDSGLSLSESSAAKALGYTAS